MVASGGAGDMGTPVRFVTPIAVYGGLFRERFVPFLLHFLLLGLSLGRAFDVKRRCAAPFPFAVPNRDFRTTFFSLPMKRRVAVQIKTVLGT